jgi:predicted transcriptional regulator/ribosomal protein S18 acetylase RimI-like enzyme
MSLTDLQSLLVRPAVEEDCSAIREFLLESSHLYPEIETWWRKRVRASLKEGTRVVLVVDSGRPGVEGLFIGKLGDSAKLCTLRLRESVRNQGIGRVLVTEGLRRLLAKGPSKFHVTVSEAAEEGCAAFFESIGFQRIAIEPNRYAPGIDELVYSCTKSDVMKVLSEELDAGVERTLFGVVPKRMARENTLLMSLRPEYAEMVLKGRKSVEFRRRFSTKYEGATIVFYITRPVKQFMFTATASRVDHQGIERLWSDYRDSGGISRTIFERYFSGVTYGYAIHLANIRSIPNQLVLERAREVYPRLRPPQSFQRLPPHNPLARALELPVNV